MGSPPGHIFVVQYLQGTFKCVSRCILYPEDWAIESTRQIFVLKGYGSDGRGKHSLLNRPQTSNAEMIPNQKQYCMIRLILSHFSLNYDNFSYIMFLLP